MPPTLDVSVVLPTYNEAQTLPRLIPSIARTLEEAQLTFEVIVVDDDSPDGTAEVARSLAQEHPVRVIHRRDERGLATAVLAGFDASDAQVCVVMDADGSHPVGALPDMVHMVMQDRTDIAVGSRHVPGGGSDNWPLFSQLKSKFAASLALGVTTLTDPTTGFMAVRRSLLEGLQLDPVGWKIVLETVVKASPARVSEHPIVFTDRTHGQSKQNLGVLLEYLHHLGKLYAHRYPSLTEFLLFCTVGLIGVFVDLSVVVGLKESLSLDTRLCAVGGFAVAVTSNFVLNRRWTFPRARELPWLSSYATFVAASLLGLSVRITTVHLLMQLPGMELGYGYVFSNLVGIAGATAFNFVGAKFFAFDPERLTFRQSADVEVAPPAQDRPPRILWTAIVVALCASAVLLVQDRQLQTDDEGINVTMARNIASSSALLLRPSTYPGGTADWVADDLPQLGNLPLYPAVLALADMLGGLAGMGALSMLCLWVAVLFTARTAALVNPRAGPYVGALMLSSPASLLHFGRLEFEPMLVASCAAGLFLLVSGVEARSRARSAAGGALLGVGFLVKMWLIVPYALAGIGFFIVQAALAQAQGRGTRLRQCAAAAALAFGVVATAHLALIAVAAPGDLPLWLRHVYFGIFSGVGVTGEKLSTAPAQPVWYYPALLLREHPMLLPLSLFGLPALLRSNGPRRSWLLATLAFGLAALVPLSVPAAKEPLYALGVVPFLYMGAGLSIAAFEGSSERYAGVDASVVRAVCGLCLVVVAATLIGWWLDDGTQLMDVAHTAGAMALCAVVAYAWLRGRRHVATAVAVVSLLSLSMATGEAVARRDDAPARLAAVLGPVLRNAAPAEVSFVAEDHRLLRGYLARTGAPPSTLGEQPAATLRAFVLPRQWLADSHRAELRAWLQHHARELDAGAYGHEQRVFIRR